MTLMQTGCFCQSARAPLASGSRDVRDRSGRVLYQEYLLTGQSQDRSEEQHGIRSVIEQSMDHENARDLDRAWDLMKKIGFAMLVTRDGDKLRARPMSAHLERESNAIYFLTDARRHKDEGIAKNPSINLSFFANASDQKYVSVTGTALVSDDHAKIQQLFSTPTTAWWSSADDLNIRVLKITPDDAEIWDSPGTVIKLCEDGCSRGFRLAPCSRCNCAIERALAQQI